MDKRVLDDEIAACLRMALDWIDAVPSDLQLPAMPGFDRDYVDSVIARYGQPAQPAASAEPPIGYVHLVPDEHSGSYDVRFWKPVSIGTKLYAAPTLPAAAQAQQDAATPEEEEAWTQLEKQQ